MGKPLTHVQRRGILSDRCEQRHRSSQYHFENSLQDRLHRLSCPEQRQLHCFRWYSGRSVVLWVDERPLLAEMGLGNVDHHPIHLRRPQRRLIWRWFHQWHARGAYGLAVLAGYRHWVRTHPNLSWAYSLQGLSGEYPAGSVACAESTGELKEGHRNRWFIMFTNVQIDLGFVAASFVPMIVVLACTDSHLRAAWRICLGLGVIPPLSLIYLRLKLNEPEEFNRETMRDTRTPWWLVIK